MRVRDVPAWLTDRSLLDDLQRRGQQALERVAGRPPSAVDRHKLQRAGWRAVDPSEAGLYFVDANGIPLAPSEGLEDWDDLDSLPTLRGLLPVDKGRILRSIADRVDPSARARQPRGGRPPAAEDRVAIREWYRSRLRANEDLQAAVLAEASRPSEQALNVLGRRRVVLCDEGTRVTVVQDCMTCFGSEGGALDPIS